MCASSNIRGHSGGLKHPVLADPGHEEHDRLLDWSVGRRPNMFDLGSVNVAFQHFHLEQPLLTLPLVPMQVPLCAAGAALR